MEKYYVKESDVPITNTRKDFVRRFINSRPATYLDSNFNELQCESGRYRSVTELHQIVLSRFPVTSFEAILRIIRDLINEENPVSLVWCTQVNKVVLKYLDAATRQYMTKYSIKNYYREQGVDGYSLEDYDNIINKLNK